VDVRGICGGHGGGRGKREEGKVVGEIIATEAEVTATEGIT